MADITEAITKIKSGDKQGGAVILKQLIRENQNNERAWLWMSVCSEKAEDKRRCLQKVLEINPNHEKAKAALAKLEEPSLDDLAVVEKASVPPNTKACPNCGAMISVNALECPYCHQTPNKLGAIGHQMTKLGLGITSLTILLPILIVMCICLYTLVFSGGK